MSFDNLLILLMKHPFDEGDQDLQLITTLIMHYGKNDAPFNMACIDAVLEFCYWNHYSVKIEDKRYSKNQLYYPQLIAELWQYKKELVEQYQGSHTKPATFDAFEAQIAANGFHDMKIIHDRHVNTHNLLLLEQSLSYPEQAVLKKLDEHLSLLKLLMEHRISLAVDLSTTTIRDDDFEFHLNNYTLEVVDLVRQDTYESIKKIPGFNSPAYSQTMLKVSPETEYCFMKLRQTISVLKDQQKKSKMEEELKILQTDSETRQWVVNIYLKRIKEIQSEMERESLHDDWSRDFFSLFWGAFEKLKYYRSSQSYSHEAQQYVYALDQRIYQSLIDGGNEAQRDHLQYTKNAIKYLINYLLAHKDIAQESDDNKFSIDFRNKTIHNDNLRKLGKDLTCSQYMNIDAQFQTLNELCNILNDPERPHETMPNPKDRQALIQQILLLKASLWADIVRDPSIMEPAGKGGRSVIQVYCQYLQRIVKQDVGENILSRYADLVVNHPHYYKISERSRYAFLQCVLLGVAIATVVVLGTFALCAGIPELAGFVQEFATGFAKLVNGYGIGLKGSSVIDATNLGLSTVVAGGFIGWARSATRKPPLSLDIKTTEFNNIKEKLPQLRVS